MSGIINLHLYNSTNVPGPIAKEIKKISQEHWVWLRIYCENFIHFHCQKMLSEDFNLLRQLLIYLKDVFSVYYEQRWSPFFTMFLPQKTIKTICIDIFNLFKFLILSLLLWMNRYIPYSRSKASVFSRVWVFCNA